MLMVDKLLRCTMRYSEHERDQPTVAHASDRE